MSDLETIKSNIEDIKKETEAILLAPKSMNESGQEYGDANYKGWVLDPYIQIVVQKIDELQYNEYLLKRLRSWINELHGFVEEDLKALATKRNYRFQESYIKHFIAAISKKTKTISEYVENENDAVDIDPTNTSLTRDETALLILYLQEQEAILPNTIISDNKLSQAFEALTGYKKEQIRKSISGKSRVFKNEISTKKHHYNKLKTVLSNIIQQIDKDLDSFN